MSYERKHQPLAPRRVFVQRVARHGVLAILVLAASIAVGTLGYREIDGRSWTESFLNACMLLGGMGPVGDFRTRWGEIFAAFFALYSGLVFIAVSGLVLAPFLHRLFHRYHLEK
jgi:hypothetical protein